MSLTSARLPGAIAALLALGATCCAASESPRAGRQTSQVPLGFVLEGPRSPRPEQYLLGQGIRVRVKVENLTGEPVKLSRKPFSLVNHPASAWKVHLVGDAVDGPCSAVLTGMLRKAPVATLAPRETITHYLEPDRRLGPGRYEMWVEYDSFDLGWDLESQGIPRIRVASNHHSFEVVAPTGLDAEVYDRFESLESQNLGREAPRSWCTNMLEDAYTREIVLKEYPTSTYAGWAIGGLGGYQDVERMLMLLRGRTAPLPPDLKPEIARSHAETRAGLRRVALEQRQQLVAYLQLRPDFVDADRMKLGIAYCSLEGGEPAEALEVLEQLVKVPDLPPWMREQVEALLTYAKSLCGKGSVSGTPPAGRTE